MSEGVNRISVREIERALFVVVLDQGRHATLSERGKSLLHGNGKLAVVVDSSRWWLVSCVAVFLLLLKSLTVFVVDCGLCSLFYRYQSLV